MPVKLRGKLEGTAAVLPKQALLHQPRGHLFLRGIQLLVPSDVVENLGGQELSGQQAQRMNEKNCRTYCQVAHCFGLRMLTGSISSKTSGQYEMCAR